MVNIIYIYWLEDRVPGQTQYIVVDVVDTQCMYTHFIISYNIRSINNIENVDVGKNQTERLFLIQIMSKNWLSFVQKCIDKTTMVRFSLIEF